MLIPSFSLRSSLIGTAICAVFCLVLSQAVGGSPWAIVVSVAVLSLLVTFVFHALMYLVTFVLTKLVGQQQAPALTSQGGLQSTPDQQIPVVLGQASSDNSADSNLSS